MNHHQIKKDLKFLTNKQLENTLFNLKLLKTKDKDLPLRITLTICKIKIIIIQMHF